MGTSIMFVGTQSYTWVESSLQNRRFCDARARSARHEWRASLPSALSRVLCAPQNTCCTGYSDSGTCRVNIFDSKSEHCGIVYFIVKARTHDKTFLATFACNKIFFFFFFGGGGGGVTRCNLLRATSQKKNLIALL